MPEYTPVQNDQADFELQTHTPVQNDAVDFELGGGGVQAPTTTVDIQTPDPTIAGAGAATVPAGTETVGVSPPTPTATGTGAVSVSSGTETVALEAPTPGIKAAETVAAPTTTIEVADPTPTAGISDWTLNGTPVRVTSVSLTPTRLELGVVARDVATRDLLDTLDDNAGDVTERQRADGTTDGLDTSGGSNTFPVTPPVQLRPPRIDRDWLVEDVTRDRTSADTRATTATITLVNAETRTPVTGHADPSDASVWTFDMTGGRIVTGRVSGIEQGATTQLRIIMTPAQAELFETVAAATAGAVVTAVPDGETFARDTTPGSRQTVTATPPSGATDPAIPAGEYVIENWESFGADGGTFRVTVQLSSRYES